MAPVSTRPELATAVTVTRWSRAATATAAMSVLALAVLAVLPYLAGTGITQALVTLFLLVSMAALWNLLAGYAGMISFGQQAYLGIGAYLVWLVSKTGGEPVRRDRRRRARLRGGCRSHLRPAAPPHRRLFRGGDLGGRDVLLPVRHQPAVAGRGDRRQPGRAAVGTAAGGPAGLHVLAGAGADGGHRGRGLPARAQPVRAGQPRRARRARGRGGDGRGGAAHALAGVHSRGGGVRSGWRHADRQHAVHRPGHRVQRELQRRHAVHGGDRGHRDDGGPDRRRGHLLRRAGVVLLVRGVVPGGDRRGGDRCGAHRAGGPVGDSRAPRLVPAAGRLPGPRRPGTRPGRRRGRGRRWAMTDRPYTVSRALLEAMREAG